MKTDGITILIIAVFLLVFGQSAKPDSDAKKTPLKTETRNEADYETFKKQNPNFIQPDKKYTFKNGETFCIELVTNPSTGFDWYFPVTSAGKLPVNKTEDLYFSGQKKDLTGSPSRRVVKYQAVTKGETVLIFKYYRSWESEKKAEQTKKYSIRVK